MVNFYEEFKLDKNASAAELTAELVRLEAVWHKREITRPEVAVEKLALINQAKKVFASDMAKTDYDRDLFAAPAEDKPEDPDAERRAQFRKWRDQASDYYYNAQFDLAKAALEKAMSHGSGEDDPAFCNIAALIYRKNRDLATAMSYVNKAIVSEPDLPEYYITKSLILSEQYDEARNKRNGDWQSLIRQQRDALMTAADKAAARGDNESRGRAYGCMAFSLYWGEPKDEAQAETFAQEGLKLGDRWGNAQRVMDEISGKRETAEKAAQAERERREKLEREARERQAAAERAEREKQEALARKKKAKRRNTLIFLGVIVAIGLGALLSVRHNLTSIGAHVKYKYEESTGTLTISGKGATRDYPTGLVAGMGLNWAPWEQNRNHYSDICALIAPMKFTASDVRTLVIGDGITSIGEEIFNFPNLEGELTIPDSVRTIGDCAFEGTGKLEMVYLSDTVESIDSSAFSYHSVLVYDGTLEQWTQIGLYPDWETDQAGGFNTRRAYEIRCTNGRIYREEGGSTYERNLTVEYDGTLEEFDAAFGWIDPEDYDTGLVEYIYCADGEINGET